MTDNAFAYVRNGSLRELLEAREIRHLRTQPYRPRTNGKVEPFHLSRVTARLHVRSTNDVDRFIDIPPRRKDGRSQDDAKTVRFGEHASQARAAHGRRPSHNDCPLASLPLTG
jgi:transposase InsO family protein